MAVLIIFDMDGVLVDSEPIYMTMNKKLFSDLGADISSDEHNGFVGMSATKMWSYIKDKANLSHSVDELKRIEKDLKYQILKDIDLVEMQGITELLKKLKENNYLIALASSSERKNIEVVINKLNINSYFDFLISGEEVKNGKPEPDIFLKVAEKFNLEPKDCFVIEDSNNGVRAAKSANMWCIGINNPNSGNQDLSLADLVINNFNRENISIIFDFINSKTG